MGCACLTRVPSVQTAVNANITRLAINLHGRLGSLYNAQTDRLTKLSLLSSSSTPIILSESLGVSSIKVGKLEAPTLSSLIGADKELWLSLCLQLVNSKGISSIIQDNFVIDEYTRFLFYSYVSSRERINSETDTNLSKKLERSIINKGITHVVNEIEYGIHAIIVLQVYPDAEYDADQLLRTLKDELTNNITNNMPSTKEPCHVFSSTKVYSNIMRLNKLDKLTSICKEITKIMSDPSQKIPIQYSFQSIETFYPRKKAIFIPLNEKYMAELEPFLLKLSTLKKQFDMPIKSDDEKTLEESLQQLYTAYIEKHWVVKCSMEKMIEKAKEVILQVRSGRQIQGDSIMSVIDPMNGALLQELRKIVEEQHDLLKKASVIRLLKGYQIKYMNMQEKMVDCKVNPESIFNELFSKGQQVIYCFDDRIEKPYLLKWRDLFIRMMNEHEKNSQLEFVYADFSYCKSGLSKMTLSSSEHIHQLESMSSKSSTSLNDINVLLFGESGVGKSTFANAIVNYLHFDSLEKARSSQPIVLMPIHFMLSVGDQFDSRIIEFGEKDPNENHNDLGQSVTQYCRSYVYNLDSKTKLRLIDAPGMGDSRGVEQDDLNMQHVLSYITNLSHLNAICLLLKPNESKLNVIFRLCIHRLFSFLGEAIHPNIIFCFTNSRSTFYTPGNTAPILKSVLAANKLPNVPFQKTNVFCFDNESFRYLVALKNGIEFDEYSQTEYEQSWTVSVNAAKRWKDYICQNLKPCRQEVWMSIEHAQIKANRMILPVLESTRNTMRNIISLEEETSNSLVRLCPRAIEPNSYACNLCKSPSQMYGDVWISDERVHHVSGKCNECACSVSEHRKLDYILDYQVYDKKIEASPHDMRKNLGKLKRITKTFAYFYKGTACMDLKSDPVLSLLKQMIAKEKRQNSNSNKRLLHKLNILRDEYKNTWHLSMANSQPITLQDFYESLRLASEMDDIKSQLEVINKVEDRYAKKRSKKIK